MDIYGIDDIFEEYDDFDQENEVMTEGAGVIKVLAVIAGGIALGAVLLGIIKRIKAKKEMNKNVKDAMNTPAHDSLKQIQGSIEDEIKNLKEKRDAFKKISKDKSESKEKRKEARKLIKEVNASIKNMKGFSKQVAKLAKEASIPYAKINEITSSITKAMQDNANIKFASESAVDGDNLSDFEKFVYENILGFEVYA